MINKIKNKINNDIHLEELLKGSSIAFVLRVIGIIAGYIFTLLITRGYGAEARGIFALSFTLLQISFVIGRLGMDTALLRFVAEYSSQGKLEVVKDIYKKVMKIVIPFSIFLSILVFFLSPYIAEYIFKKPHLTFYFQIASMGIVPFVLLFIHTESLRGLKKIKEYMLFQYTGIYLIASLILGTIILLKINFFNKNLYEEYGVIVITYVFSAFIISILAWINWKKNIKFCLISLENKLFTYSKLLKTSIPLLFSSSLNLIMLWSDTIMLGIFRTEEEVGIYNVALRISMVTSITLMAINTIAAPKFAEFWGKGDMKGLAKIAQQSTKLIFWTSFPISLIFLIFPKQILGIFGEEFVAGVTVLIIFILGQLIIAVFGNIDYILQMTGYHNFYRNAVFACSIINIILNYSFIPTYGIIGASLSTTISILILKIILLFKVRNILNIWILYIPKL